MNPNAIRAIVFPLIGLVIALYVILAVLTGDGNSVGQAALFGMIACFFGGVMFPTGGVYLMVLLAAYSDLIKRTMILETNISMFDITYVLGMAPMALAGAVVAILFRKIFQGDIEKRDVFTFGLATFLLFGSVLGTIIGSQDGIGLRSLRGIADYGAFAYLIFVLPILFPTRGALVKLMKFTLVVFIPVAVYGIWQRTFGLAEFEHAYLLTGLSTESRQLNDVEVRPFSTLNAATSLTMVTAMSVVFCLICRRAGQLSWLATSLLIPLFAVACFMTFTRVGWAALIASLCLIPLLRYRVTTFAIYMAGIMGFVTLVWQAEFLRDSLGDWQDELYGSTTTAEEMQGLRIMTLSDRLIGFENMMRPENWKPFGVREQGQAIAGLSDRYSTTFSHDQVSRFLFKWGYVPFGAAAIFGLVAMYKLHKAVFRLPEDTQRLARLGLAGLLGGLTSFATGGTIFQFPANIFLWMLGSLVFVSLWEGKAVKRARDEAQAEQEGNPLPGMGRPALRSGPRHPALR